ncbi:hypothetical protein Bxe_B1381 [Paraburkholderia xenovorans LB400]|uniref:Uncharacterized protein n=1 Tax=Paraburkholderia xenovorans (strain LB400) TaxID=266265 RepID=Q13MV6_PARXL|nr:hypothetical protein Bxe_B1381 [Paraburkholderia xenovorans LB400]
MPSPEAGPSVPHEKIEPNHGAPRIQVVRVHQRRWCVSDPPALGATRPPSYPIPCHAALAAIATGHWHTTRLAIHREVRSNLHHLQDR